MHIPDGYLDLPIALTFFAASVVALTIASRRIDIEEGLDAPLLGLVSAGIFAAQMLNWPIPGGTSAHFIGGALAAILLGPHLGAISVASVVVLQGLLFADGGITAIGANVWNMAILEVYFGYGFYVIVRRYDEFVAAFVAGWLGVTAGALSAGLQLGLSAAFGYDLWLTLSIMGGSHLILGLIEGTITVLVYRQLVLSRPDLLRSRPTPEVRT